jgi:hypothetical protein
MARRWHPYEPIGGLDRLKGRRPRARAAAARARGARRTTALPRRGGRRRVRADVRPDVEDQVRPRLGSLSTWAPSHPELSSIIPPWMRGCQESLPCTSVHALSRQRLRALRARSSFPACAHGAGDVRSNGRLVIRRRNGGRTTALLRVAMHTGTAVARI